MDPIKRNIERFTTGIEAVDEDMDQFEPIKSTQAAILNTAVAWAAVMALAPTSIVPLHLAAASILLFGSPARPDLASPMESAPMEREVAASVKTLILLACPVVSLLTASVAVLAEQDASRRALRAQALGRRRFATKTDIGRTWKSVTEIVEIESKADTDAWTGFVRAFLPAPLIAGAVAVSFVACEYNLARGEESVAAKSRNAGIAEAYSAQAGKANAQVPYAHAISVLCVGTAALLVEAVPKILALPLPFISYAAVRRALPVPPRRRRGRGVGRPAAGLRTADDDPLLPLKLTWQGAGPYSRRPAPGRRRGPTARRSSSTSRRTAAFEARGWRRATRRSSATRRPVVAEDDVVASPAWFSFLADAVAASRGAPGVAGVSLQRQRAADGCGELAADAENKLAPLIPADDGLYVFGHVGPWGFSPEPGVWLAFRKWFRDLKNAVDGERVQGNALAFAASARSDGEHYAGVNRLDAELAGADDYAAAIAATSSATRRPARHARGRRRSPGDDGGRGAALRGLGLHHGYAGLQTVDRDAALCVLSNTRVAILGDSIQRYFAFTLNYFLNTGEIPPEYEGDHWGPEPTDDYYDDGTTWTDDGTDRSPEKSSHRQKISAAEGGARRQLLHPGHVVRRPRDAERRAPGGYDVLLANSGWWELKASDGGGTDCEESDMYEKGACLDAYGDEVAALYDGLLRHFQADGKMAVWRTCNCCGDTKMDAGELREGSIAVSAMNAVATQVLSDRGVEIMDVQDTADLSDVGAGDQGRTAAPSTAATARAVQYAWVQLFLNKARDGAPPAAEKRGDPIDVELSGAALAVLRDMEKREAATGRNSMGLLLAACAIGDSRMPAGLLPAGTTVRTENVDLWTFVMASLALASAWQMRPLEVDGGKEAALFMSRAQANEWKGWMQVAFVAYHYTNAQDVYVPIRWAVSAYVWLTGFGNGVYFWSSADFSPKRFAQQLWRMNFLCALLAMATNTAWIDYYFVALATVHFGLIFLSLGAARFVGGRCLGWAAPDRKAGREARDAEKALGVVFMVVLTVVLWVPPLLPGAQRDGARGTPYYYVFDWWLAKISDHTADYFWSRTRMDYLSSIHGLLFAAVYARFRDAWPAMAAAKKGAFGVCAAAALAVAVSVAKRPAYCCDGGAEYRKINAYVGPLWIPAYLLARNATPWLTNHVARPVEWIGMHSLEFYLLQFHVLLTRKSQLVLYVIPKESWGYTNMALVTGIYVAVCVKALELTNGLRAVAWRGVAAGAVWTVAAYATFEAHFDEAAHPCDGASWAVWAIFALAATAALVFWTLEARRAAPATAPNNDPQPYPRAPLLDEPPLVRSATRCSPDPRLPAPKKARELDLDPDVDKMRRC
ncbi:N-acetylneuraminate 7-O(or 9-O)-acetyltransferase [Aureococcus anophagefferens]|nr:N-acetylneuraminate 7-O(or 9-O)-acetyltransferase [Aureococcus anophagefferens]